MGLATPVGDGYPTSAVIPVLSSPVNSTELAKTLAGHAAALDASPTDLEAWYGVARTLLLADERDHAVDAFARLGTAANRLGHVALAVACARQLKDLDAARRADELILAAAKLHCRESAAIDPARKPAPPAPPSAPAPLRELDDDVDLEVAVSAAVNAMAGASAVIDERRPKKLPPTPLVGVLSREELRELASVVGQREVEEGAVVIEIGEPATTLFWVARGQLGVFRGEQRLGELRQGSFFGEIALVSSTDRTAQVVAESDAWLLDIPGDALEKLAATSPRLAKVLANYAKARILGNVMKTSGLFSRLSDDERRSLLPRFKPVLVDEGEVLIRGGEPNDTLYVLASGTLAVRDGEREVAVLAAGDAAGEQSLLSRKPAGYDVVAVGRCVVLGLGREAFDDLAVAHPGLLAEAYKLLVEREQAGGEAVVHDATDLVI